MPHRIECQIHPAIALAHSLVTTAVNPSPSHLQQTSQQRIGVHVDLPYALGMPFTTRNSQYVYDGCSNNIIRVSPSIVDVLTSRGRLYSHPTESGVSRPEYAAANAIAQLRSEEKAFYLDRFPPLDFSCTSTGVQKRLNSNITQLTLNVSEQCNLRCKYCTYSGSYRYQRKHGKALMNWDTAQTAIEFFRKRCKQDEPPAISFYGGEPLLAFNLIAKCVSYIHEIDWITRPILSITTNGTLLDEKKNAFLQNNNFYVLISLDGPKELHDRYRVFRDEIGSFEQIIQNIELLRKSNTKFYEQNVGFNVVIAPPVNLVELKSFFDQELFSNNRIQVSGIEQNFIDQTSKKPWVEGQIQGLEVLRAAYIDSITQGKHASNFVRAIFEPQLVTLHRRDNSRIGASHHYPNGICLPGERKMLVDRYGNIHPCEKTTWNTYVGDIYAGFDINRITGMISSYSEKSSPDCTKCWAARLCAICFAGCWQADHLNLHQKHIRCEREKLSIARSLTMYCEILEKNSSALDFLADYHVL